MNYILLDEYPEIEYALIKRETTIEPYVVAWAPIKDENGDITSWGQGHYFSTLADAGHFIFMKLNGYGNEVDYMLKRHFEEDAKNNCEEFPEEIRDLSIDELRELAGEALGDDVLWEQFDEEMLRILKEYLDKKMNA